MTGAIKNTHIHPFEAAGFDKVSSLWCYGEPCSRRKHSHIYRKILSAPEQEPLFAILCGLCASIVWKRGVVNAARIAIRIPPAASH